jgi:hypothetical protein
VSLKQECASNVIESTQGTLGFTILRRGVRTGHAEMNAVASEELDESGVDELDAIVGLDGDYG